MSEIVNTLTFSETSKGWTSFWDYNPLFAFSLNGRFFTFNDSSLYEHYVGSSHSNFYGTQYNAEVTLIFNENPSISKNFKTINYEGSNGWEMESFESGESLPRRNGLASYETKDTAKPIKSYDEGRFSSKGVEVRAGFKKKEGKFFSNLRNNGVIKREGEVLQGTQMYGIKGFFSTVKMKTDSTTDLGGFKQLFAASTEYVYSSQ